MSEQAPVTVLDHIDKIVVPGDVYREPVNEHWQLLCLHDGMEFLYGQAAKCDRAVRQQLNPHVNVRVMSMGNLPELEQVPMRLLTCAFHWYALSAYQYALIVGAIAYRQDSSSSGRF